MLKGSGIDKDFFLIVHNGVVTAFTKEKVLDEA